MLLNVNKFVAENNLNEITTPNLLLNKNTLDPNGLFSPKIFGLVNSKRWRSTYAYIDLKCFVLNPLLYEMADRYCKLILKFFDGTVSIKDGELIDGDAGDWGVTYFKENLSDCIYLFSKVKSISDNARKLLGFILKHPSVSFIDKIIVIPPQYRSIRVNDNRIDLHPINEPYINILNETHILSYSQLAVDVIDRIQQQVYAVYKLIQEVMKGKRGLQRKSMMGKTLDFSGRAVIISDVKIKPNQVGLPFKIAISIFKPFLIYESMNHYMDDWKLLNVRPSIKTIGKIADDMYEDNKKVEIYKDLVLKILNEIVKDKVVLLKRDPALHRLNLRALYPVIVQDDAIHVHPLVTDGYNADFDGDQMAVFLPITKKAQDEAKEKMTNINNPTGTDLAYVMKNDVVFGVFLLTTDPVATGSLKTYKTYNALVAELYKTSDPSKLVMFNGKRNSVGRHIMEYLTGVEINSQLRKGDIKKLFYKLSRTISTSELELIMHNVTKIALVVPTLVGKEMTALNFMLPEKFEKEKADALKSSNPSEALTVLTKKVLDDQKEKGSIIYDLVQSGARGKAINIQATMVAKGYVEDVDGSVSGKAVVNSLNDGLNSEEYFRASVGGRKGVVDRSQRTAKTGYLQRQMIYATASVKLDPANKKSTPKRFLHLNIDDESIAKAVVGRMLSDGSVISDIENIMNSEIDIYSPLYCPTHELDMASIPQGLYENVKTTNIGVLSAQTLGERGTQLTMQTFHCMHKESLVLVKIFNDEYFITLEDLWEKIDAPIQYDDKNDVILELKKIEDAYIFDEHGWSNLTYIKRHYKPDNISMKALIAQRGGILISQENHPQIVMDANSCRNIIDHSGFVSDVYKPIHCTYNNMTDNKIEKNDAVNDFKKTMCISDDFYKYDLESLCALVKAILDSPIAFVTSNKCYVHIDSYSEQQKINLLFNLVGISHTSYICDDDKFIIEFEIFKDVYDKFYVNKFDSLNINILRNAEDFKDDDSFIVSMTVPYAKSDYVYDVQTETSTFMVGDILTHNSGGAGSVVSFIDEDEKLNDICEQDSSDVIAKISLSIVFDDADIEGEESNEIKIRKFTILTKDTTLNLETDYVFDVIVSDNDSHMIDGSMHKIDYEAGMIFGSMKNSSKNISNAVDEIIKLLNSKDKTDGDDIVRNIFDMYSMAGVSAPLWAIEILTSQLLRDPDHPQYPYRLSAMRQKPRRIGIKEVSLLENWRRASAFENVAKALHSTVFDDNSSIIKSDLDDLIEL